MLTLLSRAYCHLCDEMRDALAPIALRHRVAVVEIDRTDDADAALEAALASSRADLKETTIGGRVVYRR